jgi:serine/threonine protein kinase
MFGPFAIHECLGVGGAAMVHRATIAAAEFGVRRELAIKRLLPQLQHDAPANAAFVREAKLAAELCHPNIVHTHELGCVDGTYYIAMELVRGRTLASIIEAGERLPLAEILGLLVELADAIAYANHTVALIHRDLSPENLIVTDAGHLKMIDFGIARSRRVRNDGVMGKPRYMAAEAFAAPQGIDTRVDVFSIGVVAWELVTARSLDVVAAWADEAIPPPSQLAECPQALDAVILAALAHRREARWPSADTLRDALEVLRRELGPRRRLARGSVTTLSPDEK